MSNNDLILNKYMVKCQSAVVAIDDMIGLLTQLRAHADDHYYVHPDDVTQDRVDDADETQATINYLKEQVKSLLKEA